MNRSALLFLQVKEARKRLGTKTAKIDFSVFHDVPTDNLLIEQSETAALRTLKRKKKPFMRERMYGHLSVQLVDDKSLATISDIRVDSEDFSETALIVASKEPDEGENAEAHADSSSESYEEFAESRVDGACTMGNAATLFDLNFLLGKRRKVFSGASVMRTA